MGNINPLYELNNLGKNRNKILKNIEKQKH